MLVTLVSDRLLPLASSNVTPVLATFTELTIPFTELLLASNPCTLLPISEEAAPI